MNPELHDILSHYQQAMIDLDADALADLYAENAVHELPFLFPGMPDRYDGPDQIRAAYKAAWAVSPARPERVTEVSTYETASGDTLIVEQTVSGTMRGSGARFSFPGILVITVADSKIVHVRDYLDGLSIARAAGRLQQVAAILGAQETS